MEQKCFLFTLIAGFTLVIAGVIHFLISLGLQQTVWIILGYVFLASGCFILILVFVYWLCNIQAVVWAVVSKEDPETFVTPTLGNTVEDIQCCALCGAYFSLGVTFGMLNEKVNVFSLCVF